MTEPKGVAIVTGAAGGVGRAVAQGLEEDGYFVAKFVRKRDPGNAPLQQVAEDRNARTKLYEVNLTEDQSVSRCISDVIATWGTISCLVNAAGLLASGGLDSSPVLLQRLLNSNLEGPANAMRHVLPYMIAQRFGHIINVSSISAVQPYAGAGYYAASKAALLALGKATQHDVAEAGIRVSTICPGWIDTKMASASPFAPEKMISPHDLLQAVRFLLSLSANAAVFELVLDCMWDL